MTRPTRSSRHCAASAGRRRCSVSVSPCWSRCRSARAFKGIKPTNLDGPNAGGGNVNSLAQLIFTKYLFAFELTSALLIVAAVAAMVLAHVERDGPKRTQKQEARARIRSGRPQPLPGPGVLSTGDAIGTPALLPDGSPSAESVLASTPGIRELPEGRR